VPFFWSVAIDQVEKLRLRLSCLISALDRNTNFLEDRRGALRANYVRDFEGNEAERDAQYNPDSEE
jgi:hypothetical protein